MEWRKTHPERPSPACSPAPAGATETALFLETEDYARFKACILKKTGIDLNLYKQAQMHRRLQGMVERAGRKNFAEYFALIERDEKEYAAFLDRMTINVSELFRNPDKWEELKVEILPGLLARKRSLKIWSAGCSYGAEPYSLAILLDRLTPGVTHTLQASDLDQKILAKAREGYFADGDLRNVDAAALDRYFTRLTVLSNQRGAPDFGAQFQLKAEIRSRVAFRAHNLLSDPFETNYDLICCRNVVIYFTDAAKDTLYARFFQALSPGGFLLVGGTERIFNYREIGYEAPLPFFYRRPL